jgi:hypothetical protein
MKMGKVNFKYSAHYNDFPNAYEISSSFDAEDGIDWIAEECAEDYHSNHDGWECSCPIDFYIYGLDGVLLGVCEVERETVPNFVASVKDKP